MFRLDPLRRVFSMSCGFLACLAAPALAAGGGLNLGWDDCGGLPASQDRAFACDTNAGTHTLVASFVAPCCLTQVTRSDLVLDLQSASDWVPDWWTFFPGYCRSTSLGPSVDFSGACYDYWTGRLISIATRGDEPWGNRERIWRAIAIDPNYAGPIQEGTETYAFKYVLDHRASTGAGACPGCATGVCIVLNSINVMQIAGAPGGDKFLSSPASRNWVTWQGGIGVDCYAATPVRSGTWGMIKTLYR